MSMFGAKGQPARSQVREVEAEIADIAQHVRAAKDRSDRALAAIPPPALPPTAGNVFAGNAIELLNKREELLSKATSLADELDLLAQEQIACGLRLQDFMRHAQEVALAVVDARKVLNQCPPSTKPESSSTTVDGTSTSSPNTFVARASTMMGGNVPLENPPAAIDATSPAAPAIPQATR